MASAASRVRVVTGEVEVAMRIPPQKALTPTLSRQRERVASEASRVRVVASEVGVAT